MNKILLFLLLFIPLFTFSQNDIDTSKWEIKVLGADTILIRKPSLGDIARKNGELPAAIKAFKRIYDEDRTDIVTIYNLACAFALSQQIDSAFHYLNISTVSDSTVRALNDADFYFLIDDPRWTVLENSLVEKVEAHNGKYNNIELAKELWRMKIKDQAFYYHLDIAEKSCAKNPIITSAIWEIKNILNSSNVARIEAIIEEHGWPKQSDVGGSAAATVFLIIQHSSIEVQKKYLPKMRDAADNGEANWSSLALLIDRINLGEGKEQIYGSQLYGNEDGTFYVKDLFEPEFVNQRRRSVGLGPIESYVERWDVVWEIEQKEK